MIAHRMKQNDRECGFGIILKIPIIYGNAAQIAPQNYTLSYGTLGQNHPAIGEAILLGIELFSNPYAVFLSFILTFRSSVTIRN